MPITAIGQRVYHQAQAAATLSLTPLADRAAIVTRIYIDKPSAADQWTVTIAGRQVAQFDIQALGNQQPLSGPGSGYPKENDIFEITNQVLGEPLVYPVPQGCTITVASVGGATANIMLEYYECSPAECPATLMNHPLGMRNVALVSFYRAASVSAAGLNAFDTEIAPNWWPKLFSNVVIPAGYSIRVLLLFLEGGGRNTYNGSADVQSVSTFVQLDLRGQLMFTRDNTGGIPLVGQASAAGSANTVVGTDTTPLPAFQLSDPFDWQSPLLPMPLREGDTPNWRLNVSGAVTGGATYAAMRQLALVDLRLAA